MKNKEAHFIFLDERLNQRFTDKLGLEVKQYIQNNPSAFDVLMDFYFSEDWLINQRTSWFLYHLLQEKEELIHPYLAKIIEGLDSPPHVSYTRSATRIFQNIEIPEEYQGKLYDFASALIQDIKEPTANKVFAMTMMYHIALPFPELQEELKMIIETQYPFEMPGYKSRTRKIIAQLNADKKKKLVKW